MVCLGKSGNSIGKQAEFQLEIRSRTDVLPIALKVSIKKVWIIQWSSMLMGVAWININLMNWEKFLRGRETICVFFNGKSCIFQHWTVLYKFGNFAPGPVFFSRKFALFSNFPLCPVFFEKIYEMSWIIIKIRRLP